MAQLTTSCTLSAGTVLRRAGPPGRQAFVVIEGEAIVDIDGRMVGQIGPGDVLGMLALLDQRPRVATVTARTPVSAVVLSATEFGSVLQMAPSASRRMLVHLGARLESADVVLAATS